MNVLNGALAGSRLISPDVFSDDRGSFCETWQSDRYAEAGLPEHFAQDMVSTSKRDVLRGLHYQINKPQGHLVTALEGTLFDVGVDLRRDSPTFKQWMGVELDGKARQQVWLPPGVAHGFCVLSDTAIIHYKCSEFYAAGDEGGLRWDDPDIAIAWPVNAPLINERDKDFPRLLEIPEDRLPKPSGTDDM